MDSVWNALQANDEEQLATLFRSDPSLKTQARDNETKFSQTHKNKSLVMEASNLIVPHGTEPHVLKFLVETVGLDFGIQDNDGSRPIHKAAFSGRLSAVKYLLGRHERNKTTNQLLTKRGATPLHFAYGGDHRKVIEFLEQRGFDQNARTKSGTRARSKRPSSPPPPPVAPSGKSSYLKKQPWEEAFENFKSATTQEIDDLKRELAFVKRQNLQLQSMVEVTVNLKTLEESIADENRLKNERREHEVQLAIKEIKAQEEAARRDLEVDLKALKKSSDAALWKVERDLDAATKNLSKANQDNKEQYGSLEGKVNWLKKAKEAEEHRQAVLRDAQSDTSSTGLVFRTFYARLSSMRLVLIGAGEDNVDGMPKAQMDKAKKLAELVKSVGGVVMRKIVVSLASVIGLGEEAGQLASKTGAILQRWYENRTEEEQKAGVKRLISRVWREGSAEKDMEVVALAVAAAWKRKMEEDDNHGAEEEMARERGEVAAGYALLSLMDEDVTRTGAELMLESVKKDKEVTWIEEIPGELGEFLKYGEEVDELRMDVLAHPRIAAKHIATTTLGLEQVAKDVNWLKRQWNASKLP